MAMQSRTRTHTTSHSSPTSSLPSCSLFPHTLTHTLSLSLSDKEQQGTHRREGGRDHLEAPGSRTRLRESQGRLMNERASQHQPDTDLTPMNWDWSTYRPCRAGVEVHDPGSLQRYLWGRRSSALDRSQ
ncbi:hypothetical protein LY78DRAFT_652943 [Colletotrichum sublineola]|nr:hypothetical protein LY78DRAFT_652943 [Colletotrichum sublineola]